MSNAVGRVCAGLLMVAAAALSAGCQSGRLVEERDALWAQNRELQEQLDSTRASLDGAEADRRALQDENARLKQQGQAKAPALAAANTPFSGIEGVESVQSAGRITVRVPGDVLFASGKAELKSSAQNTLNQIATVINREYHTNTIRVEGYTDTDPIHKSKWKDNLELSLQRAAAVHRYLKSRGLDPKRMEAVGLGEWHPASSKAKSRRVEIVVVMR